MQVEVHARAIVREGTGPKIATMRDALGLSVWPLDSVVATTDSLVCTHLDSLISVWLASPAGAGVTRQSWWTKNVVARANPGRYWVSTTESPTGVYYNFVVDSVGGEVKFFSSAYQ